MYGHFSITQVQTFNNNNFSEELDEPSELTRDENTWTPLQIAAASGDMPTASHLLASGTSPNQPPTGWYGKTALQAASVANHLPMVRLLLDAGAEVDAPGGNNGGMTALTLACGQGHDEGKCMTLRSEHDRVILIVHEEISKLLLKVRR